MKLGTRSQRWLLSLHVVLSGIWIGATLVAFVLNLRAGSAVDIEHLNGYLVSANVASDMIIVGSLGTLISGLIMSWLTAWGLFKYWAVVFQFAAAILVIVIAKVRLDPAGDVLRSLLETGGFAASKTEGFQIALRTVLICAGANTAMLVIASFVAYIRPWGKTRKTRAGEQ